MLLKILLQRPPTGETRASIERVNTILNILPKRFVHLHKAFFVFINSINNN